MSLRPLPKDILPNEDKDVSYNRDVAKKALAFLESLKASKDEEMKAARIRDITNAYNGAGYINISQILRSYHDGSQDKNSALNAIGRIEGPSNVSERDWARKLAMAAERQGMSPPPPPPPKPPTPEELQAKTDNATLQAVILGAQGKIPERMPHILQQIGEKDVPETHQKMGRLVTQAINNKKADILKAAYENGLQAGQDMYLKIAEQAIVQGFKNPDLKTKFNDKVAPAIAQNNIPAAVESARQAIPEAARQAMPSHEEVMAQRDAAAKTAAEAAIAKAKQSAAAVDPKAIREQAAEAIRQQAAARSTDANPEVQQRMAAVDAARKSFGAISGNATTEIRAILNDPETKKAIKDLYPRIKELTGFDMNGPKGRGMIGMLNMEVSAEVIKRSAEILELHRQDPAAARNEIANIFETRALMKFDPTNIEPPKSEKTSNLQQENVAVAELTTTPPKGPRM